MSYGTKSSSNFPLRILIYSDHFHPHIGGAENYAFDLASELYKQGHIVMVITAEQTNSIDKFPFGLYRLRKRFSLFGINLNFLELPTLIHRFRPHIVHLNYFTGGENILIALARLMKIPTILSYHGDHFIKVGRLLDRFQEKTIFRCLDMLLLQSERVMKRLLKEGYNSSRIMVTLFNGIDTNKFLCNQKANFSKPPIKLICVARLDKTHKYKGIRYLIDTVVNLKGDARVGLNLTIVGSGELRTFYEGLVRKEEAYNIKFLGELTDTELVALYCESDLLVLPSSSPSEGFGRVALEALSCGVPVVVSKNAGISQLIEKYNAGIVFDPNERFALEDILRSILNNDINLSDCVKNGQDLICTERLTITETASKTVSCYESIIDRSHK